MNSEFEEWARARTPALLRRSYVLTGHQQASEDLVQEVLIKMALSWPRVESPDALARRVMHRIELRRWRSRKRSEWLTENPPDVASTTDASTAVDQKIVIRAALMRLTPRQRAVLVLRFWDDLPEAETALVLGCSVGTVKSQTFKALLALREGAPELSEVSQKAVASVQP